MGKWELWTDEIKDAPPIPKVIHSFSNCVEFIYSQVPTKGGRLILSAPLFLDCKENPPILPQIIKASFYYVP